MSRPISYLQTIYSCINRIKIKSTYELQTSLGNPDRMQVTLIILLGHP